MKYDFIFDLKSAYRFSFGNRAVNDKIFMQSVNTNITCEELGMIDINDSIRKWVETKLQSKIHVDCEVNITIYILKCLFACLKTFFEKSTNNNITDFEVFFHDIDTLMLRIEISLRSFLDNYNSERQNDKIGLKSVRLFFDQHRVLHFFKYNNSFTSVINQKIFEILKKIVFQIRELQKHLNARITNFLGDYSTANFHKSYDRLFFNFFQNTKNYRKMKTKLADIYFLDHNYFLKVVGAIKKLTYGIIDVSSFEDTCDKPFYSIKSLLVRYECCDISFLQRKADLEQADENFDGILYKNEKDFFGLVFETMKTICFVYKMMHINFVTFECDYYAYVSSDFYKNAYLEEFLDSYIKIKTNKK